MKLWKKLGLTAIVLGTTIFGAKKANAEEGDLLTKNKLNSKEATVEVARSDFTFPGALDTKDAYDGDNVSALPGFPDIDSNLVSGDSLDYDVRPEDSNTPYNIRLFFNGTTTENKTNSLEFSFPYDPAYLFGDQEITFQSDRMLHGPVVDIRNVINQNSGVLQLQDLGSGTYNVNTPYGTGTLEIGSRLLSDLNDNGIVNLEDLTLLANDWMKTQSGLVGDITGPNGIPDGTVDAYDLNRLCEDWLKTTSAYDAAHPVAKVTPKINDKNVLSGKYLANFKKDAADSFYERVA